jgi:putative hydrolases of HD superfamily
LSDLERIIEFIVAVDGLKAVVRKTRPTGLDRYENAAEHSWQVSLLALLLAKHARDAIDIQRVIEILLVHDIPEIDVGDRIVYAGHDAARSAAERQAAERIFGLLPRDQARLCLERWEEYEARASNEAIFAYAIDRTMPLLHNLATDGRAWRENRIPLERVLGVNSAIGEALPSVWEHLRDAVQAMAADGVFDVGDESRPCRVGDRPVGQQPAGSAAGRRNS